VGCRLVGSLANRRCVSGHHSCPEGGSSITVVAVPAALLLTIAGQWWLLRPRTRRTALWPIAVVASWLAGAAAVGVIWWISGRATLGAAGGAVLGGTMAAVSGWP
jgi:hypothetical protein